MIKSDHSSKNAMPDFLVVITKILLLSLFEENVNNTLGCSRCTYNLIFIQLYLVDIYISLIIPIFTAFYSCFTIRFPKKLINVLVLAHATIAYPISEVPRNVPHFSRSITAI